MKKLNILLAIFLLSACVFDAKDSCLDEGGNYNSETKKCEK